jgi:hypothetical protein
MTNAIVEIENNGKVTQWNTTGEQFFGNPDRALRTQPPPILRRVPLRREWAVNCGWQGRSQREV